MKCSPDSSYQVIPPANFRCVWMLAGVLSYQLCDREFDCDNCPLDIAMRKHFGNVPVRPKTGNQKMKTEREKRKSYLYSHNHCWVYPKAHNYVRIGLEPEFARNLSSPKAVVFPRIGDTVERGAACLWIVLDGGTYPLTAPVKGTIHALNTRLANEPHELSLHPLSRGWLYELRVTQKDLNETPLMGSYEAETVFSNDRRTFQSLLADAIKGASPTVGPTLQNGGKTSADIITMLGPKRYFEFLRKVYG